MGPNKFSDSFGNFNTVDTSLNIPIDTISPTIDISSNKTTLSIGETATITFTLSESATDFSSTDIDVSYGTISDFSGSGTSYTATFTPTANTTATGRILVSQNKFSDSFGNFNTVDTSLNISIDTISPTIDISSNKTSMNYNETASITFTLSESATNFSSTDIDVSYGIISDFSGSGTFYTATFTPNTNIDLSAIIQVGPSNFTDAAGNYNAPSNNLQIYIKTRPIVTIYSDKTVLRGNTTIVYLTFNLSNSSSSFTVDKITPIDASYGTISDFSGNGTIYTAIFTANKNVIGSVTINVYENMFTSNFGNLNLPSNEIVINIFTFFKTYITQFETNHRTQFETNGGAINIIFN